MAGALALSGVGLRRRSSAVAASADEAAVAQVREALRKAIVGRDQTHGEARCAEPLRDGPSDGRVENKTQCINGVMTRKALLHSLTWPDHTLTIVSTDAIVR